LGDNFIFIAHIMSPIILKMTIEEKAKYIDLFLKGLSEASFPSTLASVLEMGQLPSDQNKQKFKLIEHTLEKHGLVEFIRGRDNSTLEGQCEYFISEKGLNFVINNESIIKLLETETLNDMDINWLRAFNRLWKLINGEVYMSGSDFLNVAREADDSIPSYNAFIEERRAKGQSTSRKDFFWDIIKGMSEDEKLDFFDSMIEELETHSPEYLDNLKALFSKAETVIKKRAIPTPKFPDDVYIDVLKTIHNCYRSAEQKPSIYDGKGEEDLRDYALAFLESRYEGAVASGESFNKEGKTDIILKSIDGSNLFVAECKVWHGAEQFHKTVEQLFGYLTWRDTKSTIIFFVRNTKFGDILKKIKEEAAKSPYFLEHVADRNETSFSFKFKHKEDDTREVLIEIMAFSFPSE